MVSKALKVLGASQVPYFRTIRCLAGDPPTRNEAIVTVQPPAMDFQSSGYWRPLPNGEIGEGKDGTPIVGRTWAKRTETWTSCTISSFVASRRPRSVAGPDSGWIYIMRSGSHYDDLYKIGLSRRATEERANELSSGTAVPTGFEVLARWEVGDCPRVERDT